MNTETIMKRTILDSQEKLNQEHDIDQNMPEYPYSDFDKHYNAALAEGKGHDEAQRIATERCEK